MSTLKASVIPSLTLVVGERLYKVEFPLPAIIKAEEALGKSLKSLSDWFALKPQDIPAVLDAGLSKHHPETREEKVKEICDQLNPEALDEVLYALCKLAFPRRMALIEERTDKATSPNV